jgi:hypothetical protein
MPIIRSLLACGAAVLLALSTQAAETDTDPAPTAAAEVAPTSPADSAKPDTPAKPAARQPTTPQSAASQATASPARLTDEGAPPVRQPEARNPLGYPESIGDGPSVLPAFPRRVDDLDQVPGGLDANRAPEHAVDPEGLLAWFQEPFPASTRHGWAPVNTPTTSLGDAAGAPATTRGCSA